MKQGITHPDGIEECTCILHQIRLFLEVQLFLIGHFNCRILLCGEITGSKSNFLIDENDLPKETQNWNCFIQKNILENQASQLILSWKSSFPFGSETIKRYVGVEKEGGGLGK